MDGGVNVHIERFIPIIGDRARIMSRLEARVVKGLQFIGKFRVKEKRSELLGSPVYYIGHNFELEVSTIAPEDGRIPAHLVVDTETGRISEDMLCLYMR